MLTDLRVEQKNRAKELIEDFMIAANQATVSYLNGKGVPLLPPHPALSLNAGSGLSRWPPVGASSYPRSRTRVRSNRSSSRAGRPTPSDFRICHWPS